MPFPGLIHPYTLPVRCPYPAHGLIATYVLLKVLRCASHSLTFHTTSFSWSCSFPEVSLLHYNDASLYEGSSKRKCTKKHRERNKLTKKKLRYFSKDCHKRLLLTFSPSRAIQNYEWTTHEHNSSFPSLLIKTTCRYFCW